MRRHARPVRWSPVRLLCLTVRRAAPLASTFVAAILASPVTPGVMRAQSGSAGPLIGLWAGVTSSTFRGADAPGPTNLTGFSAGVSTQWRLARHWALQPELDFLQKGSYEFDLSGGGSLYATRVRLDYLEVPVLVRAAASPIGPLVPFAMLGPEIAFKVGCDVVVNGVPGNYSCADLPSAQTVDYGGIAGAGVDYALGRQLFTLSVRYDLGAANAFAGNDAKNRSVTVALGAAFR